MLRILSKAEDLYAKFDDVNYILILAKNAKALHLSVCPELHKTCTALSTREYENNSSLFVAKCRLYMKNSQHNYPTNSQTFQNFQSFTIAEI